MYQVWKFEIDPDGIVEMPIRAEVLTVQAQGETPYIWALIDPFQKTEYRRFLCVGTGHEIKRKPGQHIGTFQLEGGALVFHVFEVECTLRRP